MSKKIQSSAPVVIAGVGGSGTRLIARMCMDVGYYLGDHLNQENDNIWFSLLFQRPRWFARYRDDKERVSKGLDVLTRVMTDHSYPSVSELRFIARAVAPWERSYAGHKPQAYAGDGFSSANMSASWPSIIAKRLVQTWSWPPVKAWRMIFDSNVDHSNHIGWGWKEPNTHIYIDHLDSYYENLKFIHVIRHGLDMAFSNNQRQLFNWGSFFGVEVPHISKLIPVASLKYWIRANQRAISVGQKMGKNRFLLVNFDELCSSPEREIRKIISFLELDSSTLDLRSLCELPRVPKSAGRYLKKDLSIFSASDIAAICDMGFAVRT